MTDQGSDDNYSLTPEQKQQALRSKLNSETSQISWDELQRFYASGALITVSEQLNLLDVACGFANDDKSMVEGWLGAGEVCPVDEQTAGRWFEEKKTMWAVVVAPWVLVQLVKS